MKLTDKVVCSYDDIQQTTKLIIDIVNPNTPYKYSIYELLLMGYNHGLITPFEYVNLTIYFTAHLYQVPIEQIIDRINTVQGYMPPWADNLIHKIMAKDQYAQQ